MPRLVHIPAPACHALLCPCLVMATRGPQGLLSSRLARIGARDGDAQKPFCYASNYRCAVVAERRRTAASLYPTRGCLAPPLAYTPSSSHAPCRRPPTPLHAASSPGTAAPALVKFEAAEPLEETAYRPCGAPCS